MIPRGGETVQQILQKSKSLAAEDADLGSESGAAPDPADQTNLEAHAAWNGVMQEQEDVQGGLAEHVDETAQRWKLETPQIQTFPQANATGPQNIEMQRQEAGLGAG
jgi:hypothetical protein